MSETDFIKKEQRLRDSKCGSDTEELAFSSALILASKDLMQGMTKQACLWLKLYLLTIFHSTKISKIDRSF